MILELFPTSMNWNMPGLFPLPAEIPWAEGAQVPSKEAEMQFLGNEMKLLKVMEAEGRRWRH